MIPFCFLIPLGFTIRIKLGCYPSSPEVTIWLLECELLIWMYMKTHHVYDRNTMLEGLTFEGVEMERFI